MNTAPFMQRLRYFLLQRLLPGTRFDRLAVSERSHVMETVAGVMRDENDAQRIREKLDKLISAYGNEIWVYVAVSKIAHCAGSVPLQVSKRARNGEASIAESGDLVELMLRPNPYQSPFDFIEAHQTSMELAGESFIELDRGPSGVGRPVGMYILPIFDDQTMTVIPGPTDGEVGPVLGYIYQIQGRKIPFLPEEIIHVRYANPFNPLRGFPPLRAGSRSVSGDLMAQDYNNAFFRNSARPDGHYEAENFATEVQQKRIQKQLEARHKGYQKAHRPLILQGIKWVSTQLSPKDAEFINLRKFSREEIIALFGVRPVVVGLLENNPQANAEVQWRDFWQATMQPKMRKLTDALNLRLAPLFDSGSLSIEWDFSGVAALQENFSQKVTDAERLWRMGVPFNALNKRLNLGFDELPWGDSVLVNPLLAPIEDVMSGSFGQLIPVEPQEVMDEEDQKAITEGLRALLPAGAKIEEQKSLALSRFEVRQRKSERFAVVELRDFFDAQRRRVMRAMKSDGALKSIRSTRDPVGFDLSLIFNIPKEIEKMAGINRKILRKTVLENMLTFVAEHGGSEDNFDFVSESVLKFLKEDSFRHAKNATETTREALGREFTEGIKNGETINELAERVEGVFKNRKSSAVVIARTETVSASNFGNQEAANQSGATSKSWISARDERVRTEHLQIDHETTGKAISISAPFKLSDGSELMYPGDSSLGAAAEQVIQCRCTALFFFE